MSDRKILHAAGWLSGAVISTLSTFALVSFVRSQWKDINDFTFMVTIVPAIAALVSALLALYMWGRVMLSVVSDFNRE